MTNYRDLLLADRQSIHRRRNAQRDCLRIDITPDAIDAAEAEAERGAAARSLDTDARRLRDIDAALAKIGTDAWGVCEICGDQIAEKRLAANPAARLCLPCAALAEKMRAIEARGEAA